MTERRPSGGSGRPRTGSSSGRSGSGAGRGGGKSTGRSGTGASRTGSGASRARSGSSRAGSGASRASSARRRPASRRRASAVPPILRGTRGWLLGLGVLVVLLVVMTEGPLGIFSTQADRVDLLTAQRDELSSEVEELRERRDELQQPEEIEDLARRDHGLVRPGEVPYVVVPPAEPTPAPGDQPVDEDLPWYRRLGRALTALFR
jgi:cell division protein FtsB